MAAALTENLSEILFKPQRTYPETSQISNSGAPLPREVIHSYGYGFLPHWYRAIGRFGWAWMGGNILDIEEILARIACAKGRRTREQCLDTVYEYGPGNWIYEFALEGRKRLNAAREAIARGNAARASHHYRMAVRYFAIAAEPGLKGDVLASEAYLQSRIAYREVFKYDPRFGCFSCESFKVGDKTVHGFMHAPSNQKVYPCVVITGNYVRPAIDLFYIYQRYLLKAGIALFAVDLPGMNESGALTLNYDLSCVLEAAAEHAGKLNYIDASRIAAAGAGLGAAAAARLALTRPELLKALVMINPPVDAFFCNQDLIRQMPLCLRSSLANRLDADASQWDLIVPRFQTFSLKRQGLLSRSGRCAVPAWCGFADKDFVEKSDIKLIVNSFRQCTMHQFHGKNMALAALEAFNDSMLFLQQELNSK